MLHRSPTPSYSVGRIAARLQAQNVNQERGHRTRTTSPCRVQDGSASSTMISASASGGRSDIGSSPGKASARMRSEEHTSELQSLMRISYAVFCLKKNTHVR